ncbi:MAG: NosD domain-containing protein, partial [Minisyncoccia bacterium]
DEKGGDCYLIGNWSSSTKTCTLTKELQDTIEIDGDYITLNCNDYWLKNEYWVSGLKTHAIYFYNKKGVKIKNCNIVGFDYPILINQSQEIEILENNISKAYGGGIVIQYSQNNKIVKNKILESERGGILINDSPNNYLRENLFENNKSNFGVFSKKIENFIQDIDASNLINGKQIHYLVNQENKIIDVNENPGYIGVINSKGIEIKNVSLKEGNYQQVLFVNSRDSKIENSQISNGSIAGIQILFSSNIEILKNNILNCDYAIYASTLIGAEGKTLENGLISENELVENGGGIGFVNAFGNKIFKNKISKNNPGIYLTNSSNNVINENIISENNFGAITLNLSSNNTLKGNSVLNNGEGIFLDGSSNNIIFENSISKQNGQWGRGIYLLGFYTGEGLVKSENNKIYHNNFVQNKENAKVELDYASGNFFDDGYPSGGNYWSDYSGKDENGDGIGDTPYVFGGGKDNYPFMKESGWAKTLPKVLISEVYYDVAEGKGKEGDNEWVIIHNLENLEVDISGWKICSSSTKEYCSDELSIKLPPNGFAILTPTSTTFNYWKIPPEMVKIVLGKKFGSYGLNNDGDNLYLKNNEGNIIDAMSYGNDKTFFDPPCQKVKEGNSLLRYPPDQDTNTAADFIENEPTIGKNQVPIPIIIFFPKEPVKGVKVKFDASSSTDPDGKILNFEWQIGTTTLFGTTTEFVFNENGEYQITLTVTDNDGATSSTSTTIKVQPFSFAIITDLHIGRGYSDYNSSGFEDSGDGEDYYLTERLKKVVQWVIDNKDNVDCEDTKCSIKFLVVLGDISDSAEKSEFLKAKKILDKLNDPNEDGDISDGIPYVVVFGNHDVWPYTDEKEANSPKGEDFFDEIFWDENTTNTKLMKEILNW